MDCGHDERAIRDVPVPELLSLRISARLLFRIVLQAVAPRPRVDHLGRRDPGHEGERQQELLDAVLAHELDTAGLEAAVSIRQRLAHAVHAPGISGTVPVRVELRLGGQYHRDRRPRHRVMEQARVDREAVVGQIGGEDARVGLADASAGRLGGGGPQGGVCAEAERARQRLAAVGGLHVRQGLGEVGLHRVDGRARDGNVQIEHGSISRSGFADRRLAACPEGMRNRGETSERRSTRRQVTGA